MVDNPSMSNDTREYYDNLYRGMGVFYQRFILGLWVQAEGAIYDMFSDANIFDWPITEFIWEKSRHYIAIDYGTQNATTFLHVIDHGTHIYVADEYYHSGKKTGRQRTDSQYGQDLVDFCKDKPIDYVVIDPSAASFRVELRNRGFRVKEADNEVLDGIRLTASLFAMKVLSISALCVNLKRELQSYVWNPKPTDKGKEQPLKRDDHGPDALRYFCKTIITRRRLDAIQEGALQYAA